MKVWAPWETAWPAGVVAVVLVAAAVAVGWGRIRARAGGPRARGAVGADLAVFVLALVVRLGVLPALSAHVYDGHEAEYWDIFRGVREVNRGGTVLYPSMQWLWWGLGRLLPHHAAVPVGLMVLVGAGSAVAVGATTRALGTVRAGVVAGVFVALHPVHAAWSSSAYNVVLPAGLMALSMWATVHACLARRPSPAGMLLAVAAAALAVLTRLESILLGPVLVALPFVLRPPDMPLGRALARHWPVLPMVAGVGVLTAAGVWPLVFPGEVPGAGERALSFCINRAWLAPFWPFSGAALLVLLPALLWGGARRPALGVLCGVGVVALHLVMASFDDYADRHALMALPLLALLVGLAGSAGWTGWRRPVGLGLALGVLAVEAGALGEMRERYYAEEEAFLESLQTSPDTAELPRVGVAEARVLEGRACAWVNEDARAQADKPLSHFNLIDPVEVEALRQQHGCVRWCQDVQDWRWSSRGVRDRAWRTRDLYSLKPVAVVTEQGSGYGCLVVEVGRRLRCHGSSVDSVR